ncbi:hypothetical protein ACFQO9_19940 [Chryseobacterium zhengzhouense]|uniref:Lipoprotein n=1 Tax=Chryseobacterium zhengzhouense TaxID=1636086 RepID=A0ABW2M7X3_9FLAO
MKKTIFSCFIIISCANIPTLNGTYKFGECIIDLKVDSTYIYECDSHLMGKRWSYGLWKCTNDTIYFTPKVLYDTIRLKTKDTLILSENQIPELIELKDQTVYNNILHKIQSELGIHHQKVNYMFPKKKLVRKNNNLYELDENGKITSNFFTK